jgi:hypothetical protein
MKETFVPLALAQVRGPGEVGLAADKDTITSAPKIDPDGELSRAEEEQLYSYYGQRYGEPGSPGGLAGTSGQAMTDAYGAPGAQGYDTSGPTTDEAMTRSEERMHVGTATQEAGRARLLIERPGEVDDVLNTGTVPYVLFVTFPRVPQGESPRTDQPDPGTCPGI